MTNLIIERLDGTVIDFEGVGIGVRDFAVSSPYYQTSYENIDGRDGSIDMGTSLGYRIVDMDLYFEVDEFDEYALKRDEVFGMLSSLEPFFITETRNPGKRWKVKVYGGFNPNQHGNFGLFSVSLTVPSGTSESVNLSKKKYNSSAFRFKNEGNRVVDMRKQDETEITFKGPSSNLTIKNVTTGDTWVFNGSTIASDVIKLKGVRSTKNDISIFKDTNKRMISLAVGNNEFEISGAIGVFELTIATRFYFL